MKILIATDNYHPNVNGASYFAQRLAHHLKLRGHAILVIAPGRTLRTEKTAVNGIDVFGLRSVPIFLYQGFRWSPSLFGRYDIKKAIRAFSPDVIHVQDHFFIGATVVKLAKELGIPVVGTNHFMPENLTHYLHLPQVGEKVVANAGWRLFRAVYEKLDVVTTPTESAAALLKNIGLKIPVVALSCGIDRERFNTTNDGDYLRVRYNLPKAPTVLYVGRLDQEKRIDLLLRAFAEVVKNFTAHFIIAGKGAETKKLMSLATRLNLEGRVTFTGFVPEDDLPNLYRVADCFIISGIAELQSIVTMEAMASGLPIIAVNAMALPELVKHRKNGFLFNLDDTVELSGYILKILGDEQLRKNMAAQSLALIEKHDINTIMTSYEQIYQNLRQRRN